MITQIIYLLHFNRPFGHACHYMDSAVQIEQRLTEHRNGKGAPLMLWVAQAVISWQLVRTLPGGRRRRRIAA